MPRQVLTAFVALALAGSLCGPLLAQAPGAPTYKVGDRVQCAPYGSQFSSATIIGVQPSFQPGAPPSSYKVRLDSGQEFNVYNSPDHFRAQAAQAPPPAPAAPGNPAAPGPPQAPPQPQAPDNPAQAQGHVAPNGTVQADRPCLDCLNMTAPSGRNGDPPPIEALKKLIRCALDEHAADPGSDGAITIDITNLTVGASRPWERTDHGEGSYGTVVWPLDVTFTATTFYRTRTVRQRHQWPFTAFVNKKGKWYAQTTAGPRKDWPQQETAVR